MGRKLVNIVAVANVYVGAVIGAGFASGREIINFFTVHGEKSSTGVLLATLLFIATGVTIVITAYLHNANSYRQLFVAISNQKLGNHFASLVTVFLYLGLIIMISGAASLMKDMFGWPLVMGAGLMAVVIWVTMIFGVKGLLRTNAILVPMLIIISLFVKWSIGLKPTVEVVGSQGMLLHALLYVCFNSIIISVVVTSLIRELDLKTVIFGVLLGALVLGGLLYEFNWLMLSQLQAISAAEIPMLSMIKAHSTKLSWAYGALLWAAFMSTAIANAFGILQELQVKHHRQLLMLALLVPTIPVATLGFSRLVKIIYPAMGYLALIFVIALYFWPWRKAFFYKY